MRQIEESWTINVAEEFNKSWINLQYNSMMELFNKYPPISMCVGCKPQRFGNEQYFLWFKFYFVDITDN